MPIEFRHLKAFKAVAEELSFRKAAERLGVAQPALSRTIHDLELLMSVQLFERSTRSVTITGAGKMFQRSTDDLLASLSSAVSLAQQAEKGVAGELRIGYNDFAMNGLLPAIVRRFRSTYPQVSVWLGQVPSFDMVRQVEKGRLDAAFHMGPAAIADLDSMLIRDERLVAVLPDTHRLCGTNPVPLNALADEQFIMGRRDTWIAFHQLIGGYCRDAGFNMNIIQEALNSDGIIGLVGAGLGVTLYVDSDWLHTTRGIHIARLEQAGPRVETLLSWSRSGLSRHHTLQNFLGIAQDVVDAEGVRLK